MASFSRGELLVYFGAVGPLQLLFVQLDLDLVLLSELLHGFRQLVLELLLPARLHLHQPGLVAAPHLPHLLRPSESTLAPAN